MGYADGRFKLTIPAGALGNNTSIVITELTGNAIPQDLQGADIVYRLEPNGLQFATPAQATVVRQGQFDPPAGGSNVIVPFLRSGATVEPVAGASMSLAASGQQTLTFAIPHFSEASMHSAEGITVFATRSITQAQLESPVDYLLRVRKDSPGSSLTIRAAGAVVSPELEPRNELEMSQMELPGGTSGTAMGDLQVFCNSVGTGQVRFTLTIGGISDAFLQRFRPQGFDMDVSVNPGGVSCIEAPPPAGRVIPVGSFPVGLTKLENVYLFRGRFTDFATREDEDEGDYAFVAGKEGVRAFELTTRQPVFAAVGPSAFLGTNLLGVAVLSRRPGGPDSTAIAIGHSASNYGMSHWVVENRAFGAVGVGLRGATDVAPARLDPFANSFGIVTAGGIEIFRYDEANRFYAFQTSAISVQFRGQLISMAMNREEAPFSYLAQTRQFGLQLGAVYHHSGEPGAQPVEIDSFEGDARSLKCAAAAGICSWAMRDLDKIGVLEWNGSSAPTVRGRLDVPDEPLDLDTYTLENGNAFVAGVSVGARVVFTREIAPGGGVVMSRDYPIDPQCQGFVTIAAFADDEGPKAALACHGDEEGEEGKLSIMRIGVRSW